MYIRLCGIGKEDSNERNPSGVSFVFVQVSLAENEVFRQAEAFPHQVWKGFFLLIHLKCVGTQVGFCLRFRQNQKVFFPVSVNSTAAELSPKGSPATEFSSRTRILPMPGTKRRRP